MLLRNLILLFSIAFLSFSQAQRKKKADTVYVYEKVTVYDTIYLEKPLKLKAGSFYFPENEIRKREIKDLYKEKIADEEVMEKTSKKLSSRLQYGISAGTGFKKSSWTEYLSKNNQQFGEYAEIWFSKSILLPKLSIMLSASIYHWDSTFELDANIDDTYLNGYYFSQDHQPLLFQRFNNKHFEYDVQLKLLYHWNNIRLFTGFLGNKNNYEMQFLVPEDKVLHKLDNFKSDQVNFGFSLGVQYQILKKILLSLKYQEFKMKNIRLKNSSFNFDIFKTNNTFAERKITFGISYIISGR